MSAIGIKLQPDPDLGVTLNALLFADSMTAYLLGDVTLEQEVTFLNNHLADNGGTSVDATVESDLVAMKAIHDSLILTFRSDYREKLKSYSQMLQDENYTLEFYDAAMGLS